MPRRKCLLCVAKMAEVDYKDVATLGRYLESLIDSATGS
jgi:ribosomal protein S18